MSDEPLGRRLAATDVDDESNDQVGEVESAVEAVSEGAEVAISVLGVAEGLVGARQHGLEVAQDGVDPFELRQLPGFALTDDFNLVDAACFGDCRKAAQAITEHRAARLEVGFGPDRKGLVGERRQRSDLQVQRVAGVVEGDRRDDGNLVLRTTTGLAAVTLATQV